MPVFIKHQYSLKLIYITVILFQMQYLQRKYNSTYFLRLWRKRYIVSFIFIKHENLSQPHELLQ